MKTKLTIQLNPKDDPLNELLKMKKQQKIFRAYVVSDSRLVIYYDNQRTTEAELLEITGGKAA